jgi:hypothetical protein
VKNQTGLRHAETELVGQGAAEDVRFRRLSAIGISEILSARSPAVNFWRHYDHHP